MSLGDACFSLQYQILARAGDRVLDQIYQWSLNLSHKVLAASDTKKGSSCGSEDSPAAAAMSRITHWIFCLGLSWQYFAISWMGLQRAREPFPKWRSWLLGKFDKQMELLHTNHTGTTKDVQLWKQVFGPTAKDKSVQELPRWLKSSHPQEPQMLKGMEVGEHEVRNISPEPQLST